MNNNTKQTPNSRRGRDNTADFKPRRSSSKNQNIGLGVQPSRLKKCNYALSNNGTELVKLDFEHLVTGAIETFNFINGSKALDAIMDVLDPTGEVDVDFKDYIDEEMNVEVIEAGRFRNIINAWAIEEEQEEEEREEDTNEVYQDDEGGDNDYDNNAYEIAQMVNDDDEVENAVRELLSDNCEEEQ